MATPTKESRRLQILKLSFLLVIFCKASPVAGGGIPAGLCERIHIDVDPDYLGYVQVGGVYRLQNFTWSDFPVFKHEQQNLYFHYNRITRLMMIGPRQGELFGLGATTKSFSSNWLPYYGAARPFSRVIDRWFYYDYVSGGRFFVDYSAVSQLGPLCISDSIKFTPCHSGIFAFNDVIIQEQDGGKFVFINELTYYFQKLTGVYKNVRPVYDRKGSSEGAYLFYSSSFNSWVVGADYNMDSGYLYVTTNAMSPEFISDSSAWYVYTNSRFQANNDISLDCRGVQTNQSCTDHNPCQNAGNCLQKAVGELLCVCALNFTGQYCEMPQVDICPRPVITASTEALVFAGLQDGGISTTFCSDGYTPKYYFSICQLRTTLPGEGEWISSGSCQVKTTPVPMPTRPVRPRTSRSWSSWSSWSRPSWSSWSRPTWSSWSRPSWSSWSSWSSWNKDDGDSGSQGVEPSWLWIVILVLIIFGTICGPCIIYVVLKCYEQDEDFEQKDKPDATGVGAAAAPDAAADNQFGEPDQNNEEKMEPRKSRIRNVSFVRVFSITSFICFWFSIPFYATCFPLKCGFISNSWVTLALYGIIVSPMAYIFMLLESIRSREKAYISKLGGAKNLATVVANMRNTQPLITWHARCYHYETRTRLVTYTDAQGNLQTRTETYQEMVVTHTDLEFFQFNYWVDDSAPEIKGVEKYRVTRVRLEKKISPGDLETSSAYLDGFEAFQERNRHKDVYMDAWIEQNVAGFEKRIAAFVNERTKPWWMRMRYYWLTALLGVTWPYRWYFRAKTGKTHYTIIKKFYLSRPDVDGIQQYDVASAELEGRELRKSMMIDTVEVEEPSSSVEGDGEPPGGDDTVDIAVDTGTATVRVAL